LASSALAQTRIVESDFIAPAMDDPRLEALVSEEVTSARSDRAGAGLLENPKIEFEQENPEGGAEQTTWSASWSIPFDGRRGLRIRAAKAALRSAELDFEIARTQIRNELRAAFASWSLSYERSTLATDLLETVDRLVHQMEARASHGEASGLESRRLALASVEVRAHAAHAQAELERAAALALGWRPDLNPDLAPEPPALPPVPVDTLFATTIPYVEARRLDVEAAESTRRLHRRFWELPEFSFGWQQIKEEQGELEGPVFGVSWPVPLFSRKQAERTSASGRLASARARHELAIVQANAEIAGARRAYERLYEAAQLTLDTGDQAQRAIASATAMFEAGESDMTDFLETLRGVLAGVDAALDLYGEALEAHRALEIAAGRPLPLTEGENR
jgi:cobalt-zinc-cadmium efflux system outer membrane protein